MCEVCNENFRVGKIMYIDCDYCGDAYHTCITCFETSDVHDCYDDDEEDDDEDEYVCQCDVECEICKEIVPKSEIIHTTCDCCNKCTDMCRNCYEEDEEEEDEEEENDEEDDDDEEKEMDCEICKKSVNLIHNIMFMKCRCSDGNKSSDYTAMCKDCCKTFSCEKCENEDDSEYDSDNEQLNLSN